MQGYSIELKRLNDAADKKNLGVMLGRLCIKNDYSVGKVAEYLGVSRETVYSWFKGKANPNTTHKQGVEKLIARLSK
jgi:DNA-binding XRE family transcriptional regulator